MLGACSSTSGAGAAQSLLTLPPLTSSQAGKPEAALAAEEVELGGEGLSLIGSVRSGALGVDLFAGNDSFTAVEHLGTVRQLGLQQYMHIGSGPSRGSGSPTPSELSGINTSTLDGGPFAQSVYYNGTGAAGHGGTPYAETACSARAFILIIPATVVQGIGFPPRPLKTQGPVVAGMSSGGDLVVVIAANSAESTLLRQVVSGLLSTPSPLPS